MLKERMRRSLVKDYVDGYRKHPEQADEVAAAEAGRAAARGTALAR